MAAAIVHLKDLLGDNVVEFRTDNGELILAVMRETIKDQNVLSVVVMGSGITLRAAVKQERIEDPDKHHEFYPRVVTITSA